MQLLFLLLALLSGLWGAFYQDILGLLLGLFFMYLTTRGVGSSSTPYVAGLLGSGGEWIWQRIGSMFIQKWGWVFIVGTVLGGVTAWISLKDPFNSSLGYLWSLSLSLMLLAGLIHDGVPLNPSVWFQGLANAFKKPNLIFETLGVFAVTLLALALRIYRVDLYPPPVHGDEGEMGMMALRALNGGIAELPPFVTGWLDHPTLYHYMQAAAMELFSPDLVTLRSLSAFFGALCIPLIYLLGRVGWGRWAGFTAAWLMTVSHLHIHYSRIALNNIQTVWFTILCVLLLAYAYESRSYRENRSISLYLILGLSVGVAQYFYYGSRLIPPLLAPLMLFLLVTRRLSFHQITLFVTAVLVSFGPLLLLYTNAWSVFVNRTRGVSVFNEQGMRHVLGPDASWPQDILELLWIQVERNINFFIGAGDKSSFYFADFAAFDPITILLFWLGLGAILTRPNRYHEFALAIWFGIGLLLAGVVTNNPPYGPRLIVMVSVIYVIAGVFIQRTYDLLITTWPNTQRWILAPIAAVIAVVMLTSNVNTYFVEYVEKVGNRAPIEIAREANQDPAAYQSFLMGAPHLFAEHGVIRFVARDAHISNLDNINMLSPLENNGYGLRVFVLPHRVNELALIRERYPGGIERSYTDPLGRLTYISYRIDGQELARR